MTRLGKGPEPMESGASIRPMSWDDAAERRVGEEKKGNDLPLTGAGTGPILDPLISGGRRGKKTIQDLLKLDPHIKVIASSGYTDDPLISNP